MHHQVNGSAGTGVAAYPGASAIPGGVTHAGHQMDINHLWGVVQELSEILAQNRAQTAGIIGSVQQMQARSSASASASAENADGSGGAGAELPSVQQANGEIASGQAAELASLQGELARARAEAETTREEYKELAEVNADYEAVLGQVKDKVHEYAKGHADALNAVHRHYNGLLEQEREANLQLRLEHGKWQAGLGRAAEYARMALRERSEEVAPFEGRLRELKFENRILRRHVGWSLEGLEDSDEEEEARRDSQVHGQDGRMGLRGSTGGAGAGAGVSAGEQGAAMDGRGVSLG